ncbi:MAG TPA: amidohydrolase, partial [Allosphingosinicella sp.]|nr:amidohydrolase [Allosphingosinicella sp.]
MRSILIATLIATAAPALHAHEAHAPAAPVPKEELLKPPADAVHYVVVSEAGKHGDQWRWQLPDGRTAYRWSQELRGWITEMDQVNSFAPDGTIRALEVRGVTMSGDAAEVYRVENGRATWKTATDSGEAAAGGWYIPAGGVGIATAPLVERLAAAGEAGLDFLPSGRGRMTFGPTLTIQGPGGPKRVQLAFVRGLLPSPVPVWLDENKRYFADISYIS